MARPAKNRERGESTVPVRFACEVPLSGRGARMSLPMEASRALPSRGMVSVEGTVNGVRFAATLEPDGQGGHVLPISAKVRAAVRGREGSESERAVFEIAPVENEPEPAVPADLKRALAAAGAGVRSAWEDITPAARRDFVQWVTSGKKAETRVVRIGKACDMLAQGKRRPCCFDRSGMYGKGGRRGA